MGFCEYKKYKKMLLRKDILIVKGKCNHLSLILHFTFRWQQLTTNISRHEAAHHDYLRELCYIKFRFGYPHIITVNTVM